MISIEHLYRALPINASRRWALEDINLTIEKGDVLAIVGHSGSGKSSLLGVLSSIKKPTSGSIVVDGVDILSKDYDHESRKGYIGMVFQDFNLFKHLTVLENVALALRVVKKLDKERANELAGTYLKKVGLFESSSLMPHELSGGEKQRVAIARTLAMDPKVVLLDEPTSALDPSLIGEVYSVLRELAKEGMTMVIVTHDMELARKVSNRVAFMSDGKIIEVGETNQMIENPQHPLTKSFMYNMKSLDFRIKSRDFDLYKMNAQILWFCKHYNIDDKHITLELLLEELLANIMPFSGHIMLHINYIEKRNEVVMDVLQEGCDHSILESPALDELSMMIINGLCESITEECSNGHCKLSLTLK